LKVDFSRPAHPVGDPRRGHAGASSATSLTFDIDKIPVDDPTTFKLLALARTAGVFQLESAACAISFAS
jgi:DNA polymerase III alpha subunit